MRYGVLDLGGEALTLAVVEPTPDLEFRTLRRDTLVLRLGRAEGQQSPPPGMLELAVETLRRLVALAERAECQEVRAILRANLAQSPAGTVLATHLRNLVQGPVVLLTAEDELALTRATAGTDTPRDLADAIVLSAVTGVPPVGTSAGCPRVDVVDSRTVPQPS